MRKTILAALALSLCFTFGGVAQAAQRVCEEMTCTSPGACYCSKLVISGKPECGSWICPAGPYPRTCYCKTFLEGAGEAKKKKVAKTEKKQTNYDAVSKHMIAEATLTAHFIAAALKAGMSKKQINAVLAKVAKASVISEFWISDEKGRIAFTNIPGADFKFPTDVKDKSQAAPFAALLSGAKKVVVQGFQPRELDGKSFKYVGVAGVDKPRIVQVGVAGDK